MRRGERVMIDRTDPEGAIAEAAKAYSNWGRWGEDDVLGTLNFLDEAKRREGAALVRRGVSFSLSQRFDMNGPQKGWRPRTNPVHTMLVTGIEHMAPYVAGRGVLLDVGRVVGDERGELPDGFAITEELLTATAAAHGVAVGRGDIVVVR